MEKMSMKIPEKDYNLLVGLVEFHFKFAEYIKEQDQEMFFRAIDYARTYTQTKGVVFEYWHENNKQFLQELNDTLLKNKNKYEKFISSRLSLGDDEETANSKWIKKKKTNKEDLYCIKSYLENFIRHSKELDYDSFDQDDWNYFFNICKFIKNDGFINFSKKIVETMFGTESDMMKRFTNE